MDKIGLIGTGIMGLPIANNLLKAGSPLAVYARRENVKEELRALGAEIAASPGDLASKCRILYVAVNYAKDVSGLLDSPDGILSGAKPGLVIVDMTTTDPEFPKVTSERLASLDIDYLDAPISGGALGAQNAQLVIMVGGKEQALERCMPAFAAISKKVVYMGSSGSGQTAKLIHNQLSYTTFLAVCEAVVLGEKLGLAADKLIDVFNNGTARSFATEVRFPRFILPGNFTMGVPFSTAYKDISLAKALRESTNVNFPISSWIYRYMKHCMDNGAESEDLSTMCDKVRNILGRVEAFNGSNDVDLAAKSSEA